MDLPDLYVIRHGETEWNAEGRWQGAFDSPLTAKGEAQARALGRLLASRGVAQSHALWCSPQGRARRTAEIIAEVAGWPTPPREDARLREIDVGRWTGCTREDILGEEPDAEDMHFLDLYARAPGGEGFDALWRRATAVLEGLAGPAVLVTHGITSRVLRTAAMGYEEDRLSELPGGQGVAHFLSSGAHEELRPAD
ncbi:histidine phosphatase family protein [Pseudoroseicyclus tamaricis]|uniref:Histidine phosphatase family protein n=1 Tax=Pseudoroseicyclus tamaricis TaxID=2705421 RepID=A0A6B2JUY2_9RHOB|nr:histidine phosphatase family protein [Pseudoroseicyclus tamaricis]NDV00439.1 histidine phosphatase family protein [Pseudoroseicyclus tamaricis]